MKTKKTTKKATAKKRPVKKAKKAVVKKAKAKKKLTGIAAKILEDKGEKWVKNNCGTTEPTTAHDIANLIYYHYLESEEGKQVWDSPGQNEGKVDYIFDSIYDRYIYDLEWITKDEWTAISDVPDNLYTMIYNGVF
jgi:hypothetical protein